jgi:hypothetical protein
MAEGRGSAGGRAGSRVGGCTNCAWVWTCGCEWARVGCGGDCGWSETWCGCAWDNRKVRVDCESRRCVPIERTEGK